MKDFLSVLRKKGIRLNVVNGELEVHFPKDFEDDELIRELKTNKEELIDFILDHQNKSKNKSSAIDRSPLAHDHVLSSSQRRLWILSQLDDDSNAYTISSVYEITGMLNVNLLRDSFTDLIERHEILRTVFLENNHGDIVQSIIGSKEFNFKLQYEDLSNTKNNESEIEEIISRFNEEGFQLLTGPLLRSLLIRKNENKYILGFSLHHIITDGWSMEILIRDLLAIYHSKQYGESLVLPVLSIQYKDYAFWQQKNLAEPSFKIHKEYWTKQLSGDLPVLYLPGYSTRPSVKTYNGSLYNRTLSTTTALKIARACQEAGCTTFMGLLAVVNALLYKYTGQEDILIGTPVSGRDHRDLENQIGFYVNTIVLRNQVNGNDDLKQLLESTKKVCLEGYTHQIYPFDNLVDDIVRTVDMSRSVLFDVMVSFQNHANQQKQISGIEIAPYKQEHTSSKFDLSFDFVEKQNGEIALGLEYNTDIYDSLFIEQLANHYILLVDKLLDTPLLGIGKIDLLTVSERKELIEDFNNTSKPDVTGRTFLSSFAEQVARTPDNIAVACNEEKLSYKQLEEASNQFALYLKEVYNVKYKDLVAIKLERNASLVICILGILKCGAAYVPIDPLYPEDRIKYMESNSGSSVLIDTMKWTAFRSEQARYSKEVLGVQPTVHDLAYVIYTSGSTGQPKGVMIEHAGMFNHLDAMVNVFGLNDKSKIVQNASCTFDISVWQLLNALIVGGTTVIYDTNRVLNPEHFLRTLQSDGITVLQVVPSYLSVMLDLIEQNAPLRLSLEYLLVTGETVSQQLLERWFACFPNIKVANAYGPAEAADDVSFYIMDKAPDSSNVPIGKPIQNIRIYVLDQNRMLCPIGVEGELYVAGTGVGRGYLNNEEKTKASFTVDPFRASADTRMYKTGDLGRWLPDGNLEFTGRKDDQIKIRGHRIELGEIENVIQAHVDVDSVVVVAKPNSVGEKVLVAYLVSRQTLTIPSLKSYLDAILPAYMLPTFFVQLKELPLSPNGKIDKKALPDPSNMMLDDQAAYVAPSNDIQHKLAVIWQKLLNKDKIGIQDNFFGLGGHSIIAIRLISQLHQHFEIKLTIKDLFSNPTIETLGNVIAATKWLENSAPVEKGNRTIIEL